MPIRQSLALNLSTQKRPKSPHVLTLYDCTPHLNLDLDCSSARPHQDAFWVPTASHSGPWAALGHQRCEAAQEPDGSKAPQGTNKTLQSPIAIKLLNCAVGIIPLESYTLHLCSTLFILILNQVLMCCDWM